MHWRIVTHFLLVAVLFYLLSFTYNDWLSVTMPRHQLIQLPAMLIMGISLGYTLKKRVNLNLAWSIAALIFVMASLIFWMLPRSVDEAVIYPWFNRIMHVNMLLSGFLIIVGLDSVMFEIKVLFLGMLTAKIFASGITLRVFDILLCSAFTIDQQKETGKYLLFISIALLILTLYRYLSFSDIKK